MAYGYGSTLGGAAGQAPNLTVYIVRRFLMILRNKLRFARWATMSDIPLRSSHTEARWILPKDIAINTTAIAEFGSAAQAATATWVQYQATAQTYGNYQKTSDLMDASWLPQAKNMIANVFAYAGAKTVDALMRNNADDTTAFHIATRGAVNTGGGVGGGAASAAAIGGMTAIGRFGSDRATVSDISLLAGFFDIKDAEGFDEIGGDYALMLHGGTVRDLQSHIESPGRTTTVFQSWHETMQHTVPGLRKLETYELGTYAGMSVQKTNNVATTLTATGSKSAYINIALAQDAIGRANLDMRNVRIIVIPPGTPDKADPLNLFGTIGWKWRGAHRALDVNNRAIRFYSLV